jgi:hypothetical protein
MQIRMTAICENEIVTLRGGACLVKQLQIAEMKRKTLNHRGHEGTQKKSKIGENQRLTEETRRHGEDRDIGKVIAKHQQSL